MKEPVVAENTATGPLLPVGVDKSAQVGACPPSRSNRPWWAQARTKPRPYLVYRILEPIVPRSDRPFEADELVPECTVDSQDMHVDVHTVHDNQTQLT
jgi:hypothetical protein